MAYLNVLLSVPESQVRRIQADSKQLLRPTTIVAVSHMVPSVGYAIEAETLGRLLGAAIDGGRILSRDYQHPLRHPVYHNPAQVRSLSRKLDQAWKEAKRRDKKLDEPASGNAEGIAVLKLYRQASARNECVVSVLLPPTDVEGYGWVTMPFVIGSGKARGGASRRSGNPSGKGRRMPRGFLALVVGSLGGLFALGVLLCFWTYHRRQRNTASPTG